jgi:RNA methyltransferase, TrmH family
MEPVRSYRNARVAEAARLHRAPIRRETGKTLVEGPNLLAEALQAGVNPEVLFSLPNDETTKRLAAENGIDLVLVDEAGLGRLGGTRSPRGPVGVIPIPSTQGLTAGRSVLVSWGVSDPGNVGTMIRTAAAFGWGFAFKEGTADPWSPKVLRAASGAQLQTIPIGIGSVAELSAAGLVTVASQVSGGSEPSSAPPESIALLIGEEAAGLPSEISASCDLVVTIEMPGGTESLNAAIAAAILIYEMSR